MNTIVTDNIYIIGCGAFAKELSEYIDDNNNYDSSTTINILGYFGDDKSYYDYYEFTADYLGKADDFEFRKDDKVLLAFSDNTLRTKNIDRLLQLGVQLYSFIHHSCKVSSSATIGRGNILCPQVIIGPKVKMGDYNVLNYHSAIAHDCVIGYNNVFSPNIQVTGYCRIGNHNLIGTTVTINPNVNIGNYNKVQAMSLVNTSISDGNMVYSRYTLKAIPIYHHKK